MNNFSMKYSFKKYGIAALLCAIFLTRVNVNAYTQSLSRVDTGGTHYQEELVTLTDRDIYIAGEKILFTIYKLNRTEHSPENVSKVVYAELIDNFNNPVAQAKIYIPGISGPGELVIPDTIPTGNYRICSSTSWMQNFSPAFYSYKRISVINPFKSLPSDKKNTENIFPDSIAFFPECGKIISGVDNLIACRAFKKNGIPVAFNGYLTGDSGLRYEVRSDRDGVCFFSLKPGNGETFYLITGQDINHNNRFKLPASQESGVAFSVSFDKNELILHLKENNSQVKRENTLIFISYTSMSGTVFRKSVPATDSIIHIDKNSLPPGFGYISISGSTLNDTTGRLVFIEKQNSISFDIKPDKPVYSTREKVNLNISLSDSARLKVKGIQISVVKSFLLDNNNRGNFHQYSQLPSLATFGSALNESLVNRYLILCQNDDENPVWHAMTDKTELHHVPELEGMVISGRISDIETGEPYSKEDLVLSVIGKTACCYFTSTDENGNFFFNTAVCGDREIAIQPLILHPNGNYIEIGNPFPEILINKKPPVFIPDTNLLTLLNKAIISMQVNQVYEPFTVQKGDTDIVCKCNSFYGEPVERIYVPDFIELNSVREIIKELIPGLWLGKREGKSFLRLASEPTSPAFIRDPLVLVDGVPVDDIDKILSMNPQDLEKIELLRKRYFAGDITFEGIIHFVTRKSDLSSYDPDKSLFIQEYQALQNKPLFHSTDYSNTGPENKRIPDFRNTLYWKPLLPLTSDGKAADSFYTSDESGEYTIIVEGITDDGIIVRGEKKIVVDVHK